MKIVLRPTLYAHLDGRPCGGTINGRPYNWSCQIFVWRKRPKGRPEEFFWTGHRGNDRRKNLRGPYASGELAVAAAKAELQMWDGSDTRSQPTPDTKGADDGAPA